MGRAGAPGPAHDGAAQWADGAARRGAAAALQPPGAAGPPRGVLRQAHAEQLRRRVLHHQRLPAAPKTAALVGEVAGWGASRNMKHGGSPPHKRACARATRR